MGVWVAVDSGERWTVVDSGETGSDLMATQREPNRSMGQGSWLSYGTIGTGTGKE